MSTYRTRPDGTGLAGLIPPQRMHPDELRQASWATMLRVAANRAMSQSEPAALLYDLEELQYVVRDWINVLRSESVQP